LYRADRPGVVSFEVPLFPGQQKLQVARGGVVVAEAIGSELVNASTNPSVVARCDHQTFTGSVVVAPRLL
jgi:hypothetical protein